jgi:hypothetical protein
MLKRVLCTCAALLVLSALPILAQEAAPSTPAPQGGQTGAAGALDDPMAGLEADTDTTLTRVQQENAARTEPPSVQGPKPNTVPGENELAGQEAGVADAQGQAVGQEQGEQPPGGAVAGDVDAQAGVAGEADVSAEAGVTGGVTERAAVDTEAEAGDLGGAMPTTASPLPLVLAGGALLMGLGAGLAGFRGRG